MRGKDDGEGWVGRVRMKEEFEKLVGKMSRKDG